MFTNKQQLIYILLFQFIHGLWTAVPGHLIFDDEGIHDKVSFKNRLSKLQHAGNTLFTHNLLYSSSDTTINEQQKMLFKEFVTLFQRSYGNDVHEYERRLNEFQKSLQRHQILNLHEEQNNGSAVYGINKFSDWTSDEFESIFGTNHATSTRGTGGAITLAQDDDNTGPGCTVIKNQYPNSIDWRNKITRIKDQKNCGSCWAFVASEQVESYWAINKDRLVELSPQELISCAPSLGCEGGNTCSALIWLVKTQNVLVPEAEYPYEERDSKCRYSNMTHTGAKISQVCGCQPLVGRENMMLYAMTQKGPLGVNVDAVLWRDYIGGIIQHHCTNQRMNHAVQLVAYKLNDGPVPYWVVRNQWGSSFGENGYVRVKYGANVCGVAEDPSFVVV